MLFWQDVGLERDTWRSESPGTCEAPCPSHEAPCPSQCEAPSPSLAQLPSLAKLPVQVM